MAKYELLPWPIGQSLGISTGTTIGSTDKLEMEGREYLVEDLDYSSSPARPRTFYSSAGQSRFKRIRIVRNGTGSLVYPRQLVAFNGAAYGQQVNSFGYTIPMECYAVDEFLPAGGVIANDLFYITVDGCAECLTELTNNFTAITAATAGANAGAGNWVVCQTAAASTAATSQAALTAITAGRITPALYSGATTALAAHIQNRIGIALSACTSQGTNQPILVYVKRW
jgi:hypothetical protein